MVVNNNEQSDRKVFKETNKINISNINKEDDEMVKEGASDSLVSSKPDLHSNLLDPKIDNFTIGLLLFYEEFMRSSSKSVLILSELQTKFPKEYEQFKLFIKNPTNIFEFVDKLSSEEKSTLLLMLLKSSELSKKFSQVFELSAEEQKKFSEEINIYVNECKDQAERLKK